MQTSLSYIEQKKRVRLPDLFKKFYHSCSLRLPDNLIGTDLLNNCLELDKGASELLEENNVANFLKPNDIVFMMHQGYQFWYFGVDGNEDPIVYGYMEEKKSPDNLGLFSNFVKQFI